MFSPPAPSTRGHPLYFRDHACKLLKDFLFWKLNDLKLIAQSHNVNLSSRPNARTWLSELSAHRCSAAHADLLYCFTPLSHPRSLSSVGARELANGRA
jgi:hypothetical protein